jgi:hypothetical protein
MDKLDKEQMSEEVSQSKRIKMGAWLDGEEFKELSKATMPEANSDHGNFEKSSIEKKNA